MPNIWLTYAWDDNRNGDVDFVAQELETDTVKVKLDRWNIHSGERLWDQIAHFITSPEECDAWVIYATQHSLSSPACREELAYALQRALDRRTDSFPIIALFPTKPNDLLIPPSIGVRLHVNMEDSDWKERIRAAAERRDPAISRDMLKPYFAKVHMPDPAGIKAGYEHIVEVRPRAGVWSPWFVAVPKAEKETVSFMVNPGGKGQLPGPPVSMLNFIHYEYESWFVEARNDDATPTRSLYVYCRKLPSILVFGVHNGKPQFNVNFTSE